MSEEDRRCPCCNTQLHELQEGYCRLLVCPECGYYEKMKQRVTWVRASQDE